MPETLSDEMLKKQIEETKGEVAEATETSQATGAVIAKHGNAPEQQPWNSFLVGTLSIGLMFFGTFLFVIIWRLIASEKIKAIPGDSQWLVRILVVPLCVLSAVLLVIVGFSNEQTAPAVGLLGTIIGYLLGSGSRGTSSGPEPMVAQPQPVPLQPPQ